MLYPFILAVALLHILLAIGSVNALIPLLLIIILIAAAAGATRGYSFFNIFGISTLMGGTFTPGGRGTLAKGGYPFRAMLDRPIRRTALSRQSNKKRRDELNTKRIEFQKSYNRTLGAPQDARAIHEPNKRWQGFRPAFFVISPVAAGLAEVLGSVPNRFREARSSGKLVIPAKEQKDKGRLKIEMEKEWLEGQTQVLTTKKEELEKNLKLSSLSKEDRWELTNTAFKLRAMDERKKLLASAIEEIHGIESLVSDKKISKKTYAKEFYKILRMTSMKGTYGETGDFFLFKLFDPVHGRSPWLWGRNSLLMSFKKEYGRAPKQYAPLLQLVSLAAPASLFLWPSATLSAVLEGNRYRVQAEREKRGKPPEIENKISSTSNSEFRKTLNEQFGKLNKAIASEYVKHGIIQFPPKVEENMSIIQPKEEENPAIVPGDAEGRWNIYLTLYKRRFEKTGEPEIPTLLHFEVRHEKKEPGPIFRIEKKVEDKSNAPFFYPSFPWLAEDTNLIDSEKEARAERRGGKWHKLP